MKLAVSCRIAEGFQSKEQAMMPLADLCDLAVHAGYDAICMRPSQLNIHSSQDEVANACQTINDRKLSVTMISGDIDIVYNNDSGPNCLRNISDHLNLAEALGAPMIRVCVKTADDIRTAQSAADESAERGITLVQQCHVQSRFETVDQIEETLNQIDRSNFGLIFEAANLEECRQAYGPETIQRLAPWIRNVYLQNQRLSDEGSVILDTWTHGPIRFDIIDIPEESGIDFPLLFDGLRKIDYQGTITVHQSAPEDGSDTKQSVVRTANYLKSLI